MPLKKQPVKENGRTARERWIAVTDEDWGKGCAHVAKLMGVTVQTVERMRDRVERYMQNPVGKPESHNQTRTVPEKSAGSGRGGKSSKFPPAVRRRPENFDLTQTCEEISRQAGVRTRTANKWKREAGIPVRAGRKPNANWRLVTQDDWKKGVRHVAAIVGINISAVWNYGKKRNLLDPERSRQI